MLNLTELGVEVFIKKAMLKNIDPFWDNYDLIIWQRTLNGFTNKKGMYRKNTWGIAEKIIMSPQGTWKMSKTYVKYLK